MSIEAMRMAIEALHEAAAFREGGLQKAIKAVDALRTAIQQAEAKTDEPVGEPRARVELMKTGGNVGLSTRIIELDIATRERLRPGDLLYTHPATGVPDGCVVVKRNVIESALQHVPYRGETWLALNAAMLAAQAMQSTALENDTGRLTATTA